MRITNKKYRQWHMLSESEQSYLRAAYDRHQDLVLLSCPLPKQTDDFQEWLYKRGVEQAS